MHLSKNRKPEKLPIEPVSQAIDSIAPTPETEEPSTGYSEKTEASSPANSDLSQSHDWVNPVQKPPFEAKGAVASGTAALVDAGYRYTPPGCQHAISIFLARRRRNPKSPRFPPLSPGVDK
jgi:hypothetical protein